MTRIRKLFTNGMLNDLLNQVSTGKYEENVPMTRSKVVKSSTEETLEKQRKRKKESTDDQQTLAKKKKEFEWKPKDCAQPSGKLIKFTGNGANKKCHYGEFEFHGKKYGLEDSVLLIPEVANRKPYVAIIKDIYVQGKERYVKLEVQWFYRPEDVEKKHVGNWESKDPMDLFYSFHRDEVWAESVKDSCIVHFVPENKQIPDQREHPGFIVQKVYNIIKKKLCKFTHNDFNKQQRSEIDILVAKTISRIGDLLDIEKEQKTLKSKRKQLVQKRHILKVERKSRPRSRNAANASDYKLVLEKFKMLTGDSDRDKRLEELLEAVKHKCRLTEKKKKASDYDTFWPNDALPVVSALEKVSYESFSKDIPKYHHKLEMLVENLKNSRMLAERLLIGELKPEQLIRMKRYELMNGRTLDEMTAVIEEPIWQLPPTKR